MSTNNIVLYGSGLFDSTPVSYDDQLKTITSSNFNSVILWTLHVQPNGDIHYNDTPLVQNGVYQNETNPELGTYIKNLKSGNSKVTQILWCIGSADVTDFANIRTLLETPEGTQTLVNNFTALLNNAPADGFDFDLEEFPYSSFTNTIVDLALLLNKHFGSFITFCPYNREDFWTDCLGLIYARNNNRQIVKWMNLQCYAGGETNIPAYWINTLSKSAAVTGITDAAAFVVPGYWCFSLPYSNNCPDDIRRIFENQKTTVPGLSGGFIWNSSDILNNQKNTAPCGCPMNMQAYANAILEGLTSAALIHSH